MPSDGVASRGAHYAAHALQLKADFGEEGVEEAGVDAAAADEDDDERAEVGVQHSAAAGVGGGGWGVGGEEWGVRSGG